MMSKISQFQLSTFDIPFDLFTQEKRTPSMIVALDGSGDFRSVQEAVNTIPLNHSTPVEIRIKPGIYKEKIKILLPSLRLIGEDPSNTILTFDDYARKLLPNGETMNTFNSYSIYIGGADISAENLTFENSAGSGKAVGQAVAAYVDADRASFKNCRFLGCQDTLFTGPLPKHPTPLGLNLLHPTLGSSPEEYLGTVRQYYEDCYIQGDIDFIFGSATAVFQRCEVFSGGCGDPVNGYITAGSTSPRQKFGYVFLDCRLSGDASPRSVYLGRPWRDHAKVAFINCHLGAHIHPEGWHNWDKPERERTVTYMEYNSRGPGAHKAERVRWSRSLTEKEAEMYTIENILGGPDLWEP